MPYDNWGKHGSGYGAADSQWLASGQAAGVSGIQGEAGTAFDVGGVEGSGLQDRDKAIRKLEYWSQDDGECTRLGE